MCVTIRNTRSAEHVTACIGQLTYGLEPEGLIQARRRADDGDTPRRQFNHEYGLLRSAKTRASGHRCFSEPADQWIRTRTNPLVNAYSCRSVAIGSIRDARRAGTTAARIVIYVPLPKELRGEFTLRVRASDPEGLAARRSDEAGSPQTRPGRWPGRRSRQGCARAGAATAVRRTSDPWRLYLAAA